MWCKDGKRVNNMNDMTREEAIEEINTYKNNDCTDRFLEKALEIATSDIEKVEQLEAENKRLKEGMEKVKAELKDYAKSDYIYYCCHTDRQKFENIIKDIINEYLGE